MISTPSKITVKRDQPIGTIIYDSGWVNGGATSVTCAGSGSMTTGYAIGVAPVAGMAHVYQTGIAGVGIKAAYSNSYGSQPANIDQVNTAAGSVYMDWPRSAVSYIATNYTPAGLYRIQFIITGTIPAGASSMSLPSPTAKTIYGSLTTNVATFSASSIVVNNTGCTVKTPNVTVNLDTGAASEFKGVGTVTHGKAFSLDLVCDSNVAVSYQIDATPPAGMSSAQGVLATNTGVNQATGVGIQVRQGSGSTPVPLGSLISYVSTTQSQQPVSIPLTAYFYQTAARVAGGAVTGYATFTMNYR